MRKVTDLRHSSGMISSRSTACRDCQSVIDTIMPITSPHSDLAVILEKLPRGLCSPRPLAVFFLLLPSSTGVLKSWGLHQRTMWYRDQL